MGWIDVDGGVERVESRGWMCGSVGFVVVSELEMCWVIVK